MTRRTGKGRNNCRGTKQSWITAKKACRFHNVRASHLANIFSVILIGKSVKNAKFVVYGT